MLEPEPLAELADIFATDPEPEPEPFVPASIRVVPLAEPPESAVAPAPEALGQATQERDSLLERIRVLEERLSEAEVLARELAECREREAERRAEVEQATAAAATAKERATVAEAQLEELRARLVALDTDTAEAAAAKERAEAAEAQLEDLRGQIASLSADLEAKSIAEREAERLRAEVAELGAELEAERAERVPPPEPSHLRFVPSPAGYSLAEAEGSCPDRGAEVAGPEGRAYRVARIGPSPLGDGRRCAYLEPAAV